MTRERGEYRGIYEVLFDGKDWCQLTPPARLVWLALKGTLGAAGIKPVPAAEYVYAVRTGLEPDGILATFDELGREGWVEREGNILWVRRGLDFEPNLDPANANHRKYLERHVASLPNLAIVDRFRAAYPAWFPPGTAVPSAPSGTPSEGHPVGDGEPLPITTTTTTPTTSTTTRAVGGARAREGLDYLTRCVIAFNRAMAQHPSIGSRMREVSTSEQQGSVEWQQDGVPIELVERVIAESMPTYRVSERRRQPSSLRYFDAPVRRAWELQQQSKATPTPVGNGSLIGRVRIL